MMEYSILCHQDYWIPRFSYGYRKRKKQKTTKKKKKREDLAVLKIEIKTWSVQYSTSIVQLVWMEENER